MPFTVNALGSVSRREDRWDVRGITLHVADCVADKVATAYHRPWFRLPWCSVGTEKFGTTYEPIQARNVKLNFITDRVGKCSGAIREVSKQSLIVDG